jgi:hypothetical protein
MGPDPPPQVWAMVQESRACFLAREVDLSGDLADWQSALRDEAPLHQETRARVLRRQ